MSTVVEFAQEITAPMSVIGNWLDNAETKNRVERLTADSLTDLEAFISNDTDILPPRQAWERADGFAAWRQNYAIRRLNPHLRENRRRIVEELTAAFRAWYDDKTLDRAVHNLIERLVWSPLEVRLRQRAEVLLLAYAVRCLALMWISGHFGEGLGVGQPKRTESGWLVPLVRRKTGEPAGTLPLDEQGEILVSPAAFRESLK